MEVADEIKEVILFLDSPQNKKHLKKNLD